MKMFVCRNCGKSFQDNQSKADRVYCSKHCLVEAKNRDKRDKPCKFQEGIACKDQKCEKCGWNPEVAEKRRAEREGHSDGT